MIGDGCCCRYNGGADGGVGTFNVCPMSCCLSGAVSCLENYENDVLSVSRTSNTTWLTN